VASTHCRALRQRGNAGRSSQSGGPAGNRVDSPAMTPEPGEIPHTGHTAPAQAHDTACGHCAPPTSLCIHSCRRQNKTKIKVNVQDQSQDLLVAQAGIQPTRNRTPAAETVAQARTRPARNRTTTDRNRGTARTPGTCPTAIGPPGPPKAPLRGAQPDPHDRSQQADEEQHTAQAETAALWEPQSRRAPSGQISRTGTPWSRA
jgi:hypothetical protein